jgi:hypothetical protein
MNHPKAIDVGTMSCYFTYDELRDIAVGLLNSAGKYTSLDDYDTLKRQVAGYIQQYERRMKDAK